MELAAVNRWPFLRVRTEREGKLRLSCAAVLLLAVLVTGLLAALLEVSLQQIAMYAVAAATRGHALRPPR